MFFFSLVQGRVSNLRLGGGKDKIHTVTLYLINTSKENVLWGKSAEFRDQRSNKTSQAPGGQHRAGPRCQLRRQSAPVFLLNKHGETKRQGLLCPPHPGKGLVPSLGNCHSLSLSNQVRGLSREDEDNTGRAFPGEPSALGEQ